MDEDTCCLCHGHIWHENPDGSKICMNCGKTDLTGVHTKQSVAVENHQHHYTNGICTECGYACEHKAYKIEVKREHPHNYERDVCTVCGTILTPYGEFIENGQVWSRYYSSGQKMNNCDECFPKHGSMGQSITNELLENAEAAAEMSSNAYATKDANSFMLKNNYNVRFNNPKFDCLISTERDADGNLLLNVTFEGTQELGDWKNDAKANDKKGIHTGAREIMDAFWQEAQTRGDIPVLINGERSSRSLAELIDEVSRDKNAHIQIAGHSLGGALAQVLTYDLIKDKNISKDQITTFTYASFVPFTFNAIEDEIFRDANVYNFVNVNDVVPKTGVVYADGLLFRAVETVGNVTASSLGSYTSGNKGGSLTAGTNLGKNIYLEEDVPVERKDLSTLVDETIDTVTLLSTNPGAYLVKKLAQSAMETRDYVLDNHAMQTYAHLIDGIKAGKTNSFVFDNDDWFETKTYKTRQKLEKIINKGEVTVAVLSIVKGAVNLDKYAVALDGWNSMSTVEQVTTTGRIFKAEASIIANDNFLANELKPAKEVTTTPVTTNTSVPSPSPTPKPASGHAKIVVAKSTVYARTGPGTEYSVFATIQKGERLNALGLGRLQTHQGKDGTNWYLITINGHQCYVPTGMIKTE